MGAGSVSVRESPNCNGWAPAFPIMRMSVGPSASRLAADISREGVGIMFIRSVAVVLASAATLAASGCATRATRLDAQWVNPEFAGQRAVRNVMVMAAVRDTTNRRMFEDRMVATLVASGA